MNFSWQGSDAFSQSGLYSNHQDIGPRYAVSYLHLSKDLYVCYLHDSNVIMVPNIT